jgi:hypothetical protein
LFLDQRRDEFVSHFWELVRAGGYQTRQQADDRPQYYRFTDPTSDDYPFIIELFSALPSDVNYLGDGHLNPHRTRLGHLLMQCLPTMIAQVMKHCGRLFYEAFARSILAPSIGYRPS